MNSGAEENIIDDIRARSRVLKDPAGRALSVITETEAFEIAKKFDCLPGDVYFFSLGVDIWPYRYVRNHSSLTPRDQKTLARSSVAVIGCGGLGGYVVLLLARIGIGSIIVVDPDRFDETNLNRQAFAVSDTIGVSKIDAAVSAVKSVNPAVVIKGFPTALNSSNALKILHGTDVVVDALDNLSDREMLCNTARQMKLPLVHGAIAGFEGQVATIWPDDTKFQALFDKKGAGPGDPDINAESILGVLSITPAFIASLQAVEVVKILLKKGKPSSGRILYADMELGEFNYLDF